MWVIYCSSVSWLYALPTHVALSNLPIEQLPSQSLQPSNHYLSRQYLQIMKVMVLVIVMWQTNTVNMYLSPWKTDKELFLMNMYKYTGNSAYIESTVSGIIGVSRFKCLKWDTSIFSQLGSEFGWGFPGDSDSEILGVWKLRLCDPCPRRLLPRDCGQGLSFYSDCHQEVQFVATKSSQKAAWVSCKMVTGLFLSGCFKFGMRLGKLGSLCLSLFC